MLRDARLAQRKAEHMCAFAAEVLLAGAGMLALRDKYDCEAWVIERGLVLPSWQQSSAAWRMCVRPGLPLTVEHTIWAILQ